MAIIALAQTRARSLNEPVVVPAKRFGFFPQVFVWRGQRHDVRAVEACQTEVRHDWRGRVECHRFRVRTANGIFELTQDPARDTWKVEKMWSA
jgi:hypothetical protein